MSKSLGNHVGGHGRARGDVRPDAAVPDSRLAPGTRCCWARAPPAGRPAGRQAGARARARRPLPRRGGGGRPRPASTACSSRARRPRRSRRRPCRRRTAPSTCPSSSSTRSAARAARRGGSSPRAGCGWTASRWAGASTCRRAARRPRAPARQAALPAPRRLRRLRGAAARAGCSARAAAEGGQRCPPGLPPSSVRYTPLPARDRPERASRRSPLPPHGRDGL